MIRILVLFAIAALATASTKGKGHLVVLCHGIMGAKTDLSYLSKRLIANGCKVLNSSVNERFRSFYGVKEGGSLLAKEIVSFVKENSGDGHEKLRYISFVGNSMGGLYARSALGDLFNSSSNHVAGLVPFSFLTIATPHLGVHNITYFQEHNLNLPSLVELTLANVLFKSGQHLFFTDKKDIKHCILYKLATDKKYLQPLRTFRKRRLYANIKNDFLVPLKTAAFLTNDEVRAVKQIMYDQEGIVGEIVTTTTATISPSSDTYNGESSNNTTVTMQLANLQDIAGGDSDGNITSSGNQSVTTKLRHSSYHNHNNHNNHPHNRSVYDSNKHNKHNNYNNEEMYYDQMRISLNSCGWEKILVNFEGYFPDAHNKICAMTKYFPWLDKLLGYDKGQNIMDNAADWILSSSVTGDTNFNAGTASDTDVAASCIELDAP